MARYLPWDANGTIATCCYHGTSRGSTHAREVTSITDLWIRTEASASVGLGHLMRMIALAQAARSRGLEVVFVPDDDVVTSDVLARFDFDTTTLHRWQRLPLPGQITVFDGYAYEPADHLQATARGAFVVAMDDFGDGRFDVDLLVNQNLVHTTDVEVPDHTRVLLGPRYALIREEFLAHRRTSATHGGRLLVNLGGTDPQRLAGTVVREASATGCFDEIVLLVGRGDPPDVPDGVEVVRDPQSVGALFASIDAAVVAAGTTTWELLYCGVPTGLLQTEENQRHVARPVAAEGAAIFLGEGADLDRGSLAQLAVPRVRRRLVARAVEMVDGLGAHRVLDHIGVPAQRP